MATRYGKLAFDDSPRTLVFRAIDDILRADPNLQRVFSRPGSFRSWQGKPEDKSDFAQAQAPAIRITPVPEADNWYYPGATKGDLVIQIEMLVNGLIVDDVENLAFAVALAVRPRDVATANTVRNKLTAAGAITGLVVFSNPVHDPSPEAGSDGQFRAVGALKIEVKTS